MSRAGARAPWRAVQRCGRGPRTGAQSCAGARIRFWRLASRTLPRAGHSAPWRPGCPNPAPPSCCRQQRGPTGDETCVSLPLRGKDQRADPPRQPTRCGAPEWSRLRTAPQPCVCFFSRMEPDAARGPGASIEQGEAGSNSERRRQPWSLRLRRQWSALTRVRGLRAAHLRRCRPANPPTCANVYHGRAGVKRRSPAYLFDLPRLQRSHNAWRLKRSSVPPLDIGTMWST